LISEAAQSSLEEWLNILRTHLRQAESSVQDIFEAYAAEAKFGRLFVEEDLQQLPVGASILEIGAGSMILSCQLAREGYTVTALEPTGEGFSHFSRLRLLVLEQAKKLGYSPRLLLHPAEELADKNEYDFAFSINVMEHVGNVEQTMERVMESLRPMGVYHFTCPNYLFPYEPHFNIPTLFSKRLTELFLKHHIFNNQKMSDPEGAWRSLNWITVPQLLRITRRHQHFSMYFDKSMLGETLARVTMDSEFASRRATWMRLLIRGMVRMRIHRLALYFPAWIQPIIDCSVTKLHRS
jgi:2-polyprenyl-3-methyl-5-hydroxy-6-metoxy-1,4-benzoquinol methylase